MAGAQHQTALQWGSFDQYNTSVQPLSLLDRYVIVVVVALDKKIVKQLLQVLVVRHSADVGSS